MADHDLIIVGGGMSGMSLAHFWASSGGRPLVLEMRAEPGGCIHSPRLEDGYWFEMGAHTCYNSYRSLIGVLEERGAMGRLLPRVKVPFRLLVDGQVRPIVKTLSIPKLLASAPRVLFTRKQGLTVRDYYSRIVWRSNYDRVFGPLIAAVPSQRADEFPAQMIFKSRKQRRKDLPRSFTLQGGIQSAIEAMAGTPGVEVRTGAKATALRRIDDGVEVLLEDGARLRAPHAALACPPSDGAALVREGWPELAAALGRIQVTAIRSVGVVLRREDLALEPLAFLVPLEPRFHSAVSRDTVPDERYRAFAFHCAPGTSLDAGLEIACGVLRVERSKLLHVIEREVVLPSPRLGHEGIVAGIDRALAGTPLLVTGNYFGGLALEDCLQRSREEALRVAPAPGVVSAA